MSDPLVISKQFACRTGMGERHEARQALVRSPDVYWHTVVQQTIAASDFIHARIAARENGTLSAWMRDKAERMPVQSIASIRNPH